MTLHAFRVCFSKLGPRLLGLNNYSTCQSATDPLLLSEAVSQIFSCPKDHQHQINYKAAGVILFDYHVEKRQIYLLMAQFETRHKEQLVKEYTFLGGKRDKKDSGPAATAAREVEEESHGLLSAAELEPQLQAQFSDFYVGGKYMAFYKWLPNSWDLPQRCETLLKSGYSHPEARDCTGLAWVPLRSLDRRTSNSPHLAYFARSLLPIISPHFRQLSAQLDGKISGAIKTSPLQVDRKSPALSSSAIEALTSRLQAVALT